MFKGSCDVSDKTKSNFSPNYIFMSFVYLTLDDMAVSRGGLGSRDPCDIQKIQKAPNIPSKCLFLDILYGRF
jgi:hypothetical protein